MSSTQQPAADQRPDLASVRAALMQALSQEQLNLVGLWLGLESLEANSDTVYQIGKQALAYASLKAEQTPRQTTI